MDNNVVPHISGIIVRYHIMTNIENEDGVYQIEILRTTTFSRIDLFMATRIWWQWRFRQRDEEFCWFETMIELYTLLQGDIYVYDSIDGLKVIDYGPKKFGGRH